MSCFRYFSVSILCQIGLPGFAASVGLGVATASTMVLSLLVIDKVSNHSYYSGGLNSGWLSWVNLVPILFVCSWDGSQCS